MKLLRIIKGLGPRKRFSLMLLLIYVVFLPIISWMSYLILKDSAINDAYRTGKLFLATFESTRYYVGTELRPILYEEFPERFIVEGMSRSYVAGKIAKKVLDGLPGYRYKNASLSPKNPINKADDFEREIIKVFKGSPLKEWKGVRSENGFEYYVIAIPGKPVKEACLRCHSSPEAAPKEIIDLYGREAGFNWEVGDTVDAVFAYIPINVPLDNARGNILLFIGMYTIFFTLIFLVIDRRFRWFYQKIESDNKEIEVYNKEVLNLNKELGALVAERTMSMIGLRVADRIRNPVTVIGGLCYRLLKKEMDEDSVDKIRNMLLECDKIEKLIKEFDVLVESKRFLFKREDLNEIVLSTVRPLEKNMRESGIEFSLELSDEPLVMNANRQFLKIALGHLLSNSIDATAHGGRITLTTGIEGGNLFIVISDTGVGLPEEYLHKIFNHFFSTKERIGMGLPLVKQIVDDHVGEITVESKLHEGTTFKILFPQCWINGEK